MFEWYKVLEGYSLRQSFIWRISGKKYIQYMFYGLSVPVSIEFEQNQTYLLYCRYMI